MRVQFYQYTFYFIIYQISAPRVSSFYMPMTVRTFYSSMTLLSKDKDKYGIEREIELKLATAREQKKTGMLLLKSDVDTLSVCLQYIINCEQS